MRRFALCALAFLGATSCSFLAGCETSQGAKLKESAPQQLSVSDVIKQNLSSWRFKPGKEVFVNNTTNRPGSVRLEVSDQGRLYLAWTEWCDGDYRAKIATSPDGQRWEIEAKFEPDSGRDLVVDANYGLHVGADPAMGAVAWAVKHQRFFSVRSADGQWSAPRLAVNDWGGDRDQTESQIVARLDQEIESVLSVCTLSNQGVAALVEMMQPFQRGVHLVRPADLQQWSEPVFLGLRTDYGDEAMAVADERLYVATTSAPWWHHWAVRQDQYGEEVEWHSPRVFLVDDSVTRDTDGDGLTDIMEEWLVTNPEDPDTDRDGVADGQDLDPLASAGPKGEKARIRGALFKAFVPGARDLASAQTIIATSSERQVFPDHSMRVLCLTAEELKAYRAKYGTWALPVFDVGEIKLWGPTAVAEWSLGTSSLAGAGGHAKLVRKLNGEWMVTDKGQEGVA